MENVALAATKLPARPYLEVAEQFEDTVILKRGANQICAAMTYPTKLDSLEHTQNW
jgi:hypothetical protein